MAYIVTLPDNLKYEFETYQDAQRFVDWYSFGYGKELKIKFKNEPEDKGAWYTRI